MTSNLDGAKEARNEIKKFHLCLNHENLVPEQCYRRNHRNYPMVSYVSQIAALFLSGNYEVIPIFIDRVVDELERNADQPVTTNYRAVVFNYLCQITNFLVNFTTVDQEKIKSLIPENILTAGPKKAPELEQESLHFKT